MSGTMIIARHELLTVIRRRSFILLSVGLPLLAGIIVLFLNLASGPTTEALTELTQPKAPTAPQGYVDHAGLIADIPEPLQASFVRFSSEAEARQAASRGEVEGFLVVPADFIEKGEILFYSRDFNPLGADQRVSAFRYLVVANTVGDPQLASLLWQPANVTELTLEARQETDTSGMATFWLPYAILMILFLSLSMASGWLLQSVTNEKDTRMLEIMLSSVSPAQILMGKTVGLGIAGLAQVVLWLVSAALLMALGGRGLSIPEGFSITAGTVIWAIVFFVLGYAVYAALIGGLGALAPSLRDASSATLLVYLPLMVPLWFLSSIVNQPNGLLAVALSLFPLTSPVVMVARLVRVAPPAWQMGLSTVLLLLTAYGVTRLVARLFRAQTLLSGQSLSFAHLRDALSGD
ncbi:MAG: ABC transporter permease [Anaerolineae bacterium]